MKSKQAKQLPTPVPETQAKQVGDWTKSGNSNRNWSWVESSVWTKRMLGALVNGVKGGIWFSLMDKVYKRGNLMAAFGKVKANRGSAGVDHVSISMFEKVCLRKSINCTTHYGKAAIDLKQSDALTSASSGCEKSGRWASRL